MNYMEAMEADLAAQEAISILLEIAEVLPNDRLAKAIQILSEGGAAYHTRNVFHLLKHHKRAEDKERLAGMFTEADFPEGLRDPRIRAALFLGLSKLVDSKGQIDANEALEILKKFEVQETPDLRDNLAAYAKKSPTGATHWDIGDFSTVILAATSLAQLARRVPWGRLASAGSRLLLRR